MSIHRFALGFIFFAGTAAAAATYGCSDDPAATPPEPDAGNPNRQRPDSGRGGGDATTDGPPPVTYKAKADITSTGVADAGTPTGTVSFTETNGAVAVAITITGATTGMHGMHIHAGNSCGPDADGGIGMAAGGHWNATDAGHGLPTSASHHPGDFGNISIDGTGAGTLSLNMTGYNVQPDGGALSAIGHAIVFHQGTDDGVTQPTGDAGSRPGCGVIQAQ